jgi:hypothetical protein
MGNVICKVSEEKGSLQNSHYWNTFDWNFRKPHSFEWGSSGVNYVNYRLLK